MSNQEIQFEQIEQYLNKEMPQAEAEQFEAQMEADSQLREMVNLHRDLAFAVMDKEEIELEATLKQINTEFQQKKQQTNVRPIRRLNSRVWLAAASIALLVILTFWYFRPSNSVSFSNQDLYAQNFTPYDRLENLRDSSKMDTILSAGFDLYDKKEYPAALEQFVQIPETDEKYFTVLFYIGICQMESGNAKEAISSFETVITYQNTLFRTQAQWFQALAHLKVDEREAAKAILAALKDNASAGKYQLKAQKLFEQL